MQMVRFPTLVLGATLGLAALGLSATASAGVRFGVDVGLPVVAAPAVAAPVLAAGPEVVAYHPGPYYHGPYYGPRGYGGAPYRHDIGPARGYPHGPVGGWHAGYGFRDGHAWRR
jgi:hypothetical protein